MLYALMVKSANDAAVALAEKVAGSTDGFLELMNKKAKSLGMTSTVFHSVHGLPPARGQEHDITTARDLSVLCANCSSSIRMLALHFNTRAALFARTCRSERS
jgi:D-alanyl-D-alanine carboxypeptidase (penicillin-binding protein 5/6)